MNRSVPDRGLTTYRLPIRVVGCERLLPGGAMSSSTGDLRIVEIGDSQLSDRPSTANSDRPIAAITGVQASTSSH